MMERMRWAILATGAVANRFAKALINIPEHAELMVVGSRAQETADAFASAYKIPRAYGNYQDAVSDPDVDIVYIGTPHEFHHKDVTMCLKAGKHVLCEKAFTMNAEEAEDIINLAREKNLFLMEAMWTRFFPIHVRIRELLAEGAIGDVRGLVIHHNYMAAGDPEQSYDPKLGIGAFMDQTPYGVGLAYDFLGQPENHVGIATHGDTGISYQVSYVLKHKEGKLTTVASSRITTDLKEAIVYGDKGKIEIHAPWYKPTSMTIFRGGNAPETIEYPLDGYIGYEYEALEVMECIKSGKIESPIMPLDETLAIMKTIDSMRTTWAF